jgi:hypothetical protein
MKNKGTIYIYIYLLPHSFGLGSLNLILSYWVCVISIIVRIIDHGIGVNHHFITSSITYCNNFSLHVTVSINFNLLGMRNLSILFSFVLQTACSYESQTILSFVFFSADLFQYLPSYFDTEVPFTLRNVMSI